MEVLLDELLRLVSEIVTGIRNQVINCTVLRQRAHATDDCRDTDGLQLDWQMVSSKTICMAWQPVQI
jgi:hypothetical protein